MDISRRLRFFFFVVVAIMGMASGVIIWNQFRIEWAFETVQATAQLENILLECRREEKNFFLRGDEESLAQVRSRVAELNAILGGLRPLTAAVGQEIDQLRGHQAAYLAAFEEGALKREVDVESPDHPLVLAARRCHRSISDIRAVTISEFERIRSAIHLLNMASLFIGIVLSVVLAGVMTDWLLDALNRRDEGP